jgi:hypothetical protein
VLGPSDQEALAFTKKEVLQPFTKKESVMWVTATLKEIASL